MLLYEREGQPRPYRGIQMRSHAEARMASLLDYHNISWQYEPDRIGSLSYLPDFYLPEHQVYIEVKPNGVSLSELSRFYLTAEEIQPHKTFILMYVDTSWQALVWDMFFEQQDKKWAWASAIEVRGWLCVSPLDLLLDPNGPHRDDKPGRYAILTYYHSHPEWQKKGSP